MPHYQFFFISCFAGAPCAPSSHIRLESILGKINCLYSFTRVVCLSELNFPPFSLSAFAFPFLFLCPQSFSLLVCCLFICLFSLTLPFFFLYLSPTRKQTSNKNLGKYPCNLHVTLCVCEYHCTTKESEIIGSLNFLKLRYSNLAIEIETVRLTD